MEGVFYGALDVLVVVVVIVAVVNFSRIVKGV